MNEIIKPLVGYSKHTGDSHMQKIGLLAGTGRLPVEFTRAARGMGFAVTVIAVVPEVDSDLAQVADKFYSISAGELDKVIATLEQEQVTQVTMIGKVTKELLFAGAVSLDNRMKRLLATLPDHSDDTIMLAVVKEMASAGIGILDQTVLIRRLLPAPGLLTSRQPTAAEQMDIDYGFQMAKAIGRLDIGQTVVVKNKAIMAVEAIEGTDACIIRGGALGRGGVTVAKTAKPSQDVRFDMPTVGPDTLHSMISAGASALVIEAGRTLLVDKDTVIALAEENNITIVAMVE